MRDTKTEFLDSAKLLLNITGSENDDLLSYLIDDSISEILAYCRLDILPRQLEGLAIELAVSRFESAQRGSDIKSLTQGERRVEYSDGRADFLSKHKARLDAFVNRAGRLPSELGGDKNVQSV